MVALVLETGLGLSNANAYATVEFADAYFEENLYTSAWTAASADDKARALIQGTRLLDSLVVWTGRKEHRDNALEWPRYDVWEDGWAVETDAVPLQVRRAACELAKLLLEDNRLAERDTIGFKRLQAGPLELEIDRYDERPVIPPFILAMVANYTVGGATGRPRFARLVRT